MLLCLRRLLPGGGRARVIGYMEKRLTPSSLGRRSRWAWGGRRKSQIGSGTVRRTGPSWRQFFLQEAPPVGCGRRGVGPALCLELRLQRAPEAPVQLLSGGRTRRTNSSCRGGLLLPIIRPDGRVQETGRRVRLARLLESPPRGGRRRDGCPARCAR
jgi:hypothetical protein